jgi:hypothetical protein
LPAEFTVILWVVAPLLHKLPVEALELNTVEPPAQKVLVPDIVGVLVKGILLTTKTFDVADVHAPEIIATE